MRLFTNNYYSYVTAATTFDDAIKLSSEASFAGVRGHLFVPNTYLEFQRVVSHGNWNQATVWLGYTDAAVEGKWVFAAGPYAGTDVSNFMWWWPGENNGGTAENCAAYGPGSYELGDIPCSHRHRYIIEFACPFGQRFNAQGTACVGSFMSKCSRIHLTFSHCHRSCYLL